jgi:hypothetical protein
MRRRARALFSCHALLVGAWAALCLLAVPARAATIAESTTGITINVAGDGTYTIQFADPAWTFSGTVNGGAKNIRANSGRDEAGGFQEIAFDERAKPARHFAIRTWTGRPGVLFTQVVTTACANPDAFPRFSTFPIVPYNLSFGGTWAGARFDLTGREGPWVFFDAAAETAVLSPAANFMVAKLRVAPDGAIESGIDAAIATLPEELSHSTLLIVDHGINRAFDTWGRILTDIHGKVRPANDADATLQYLGYWTDNGAAYYYNFDPLKGYEGTLIGVRDEFARKGLPLGYLQLDSWWYRKGESGDWNPKPDQWQFGIHTYEAHPQIFPDGLASFHDRIGLPLVTHARWIDAKSPYRAKYAISNNVATDPRYWKDVAAYLKQSGVATYEQDWLDSRATAAFTLADQDAFMDNMASALAANGITMQYCMPTPRHVLQGSKYSNLTSMRMSDDRFERRSWPQVLYASRLAFSVGIWPWVDVFSSDEEANLMIATLSAGVVGASDAIGAMNVHNLQRAARADGVIVKPDVPLVPTDSTFLAEAQKGPGPMVAYTYTDHASNRAVYMFAFRRGDATTATFTPSETGLAGEVFAYDVRRRSGAVVDAGAPMNLDLSQDWTNVVLVPVSRCGIAVVGDTGKFVPRGRARIAALTDRGDAVDVQITFAAGESSVTLTGYSPSSPRVLAAAGAILKTSWNASNGLFEITVAPAANATAQVSIRPAAPRRRLRAA